jgi:PIN domain nuclease of toxin-antitoxin system
VRLLLDTNVLLWSASDPNKIAPATRDLITDGANDVHVSVISAWEIAIKQSIGKLDLSKPAELWVPDVIRRSGFEIAELDIAAALRARALPWHHRDPFDRFLIAQALEHGYTLVTGDATLSAYGVALAVA